MSCFTHSTSLSIGNYYLVDLSQVMTSSNVILRHDSQSGRFSKSQFVCKLFLPYLLTPWPLCSFTRLIFRAVFDSLLPIRTETVATQAIPAASNSSHSILKVSLNCFPTETKHRKCPTKCVTFKSQNL